MLRSFSYAAYAGLFAQSSARPAEFGRLEPWAHIWQTWASAGFLRGYFETANDASFLPADLAQRDALLRLFMIEKALYELNYELNNRPDWVVIPARGIVSILRPQEAAPAAEELGQGAALESAHRRRDLLRQPNGADPGRSAAYCCLRRL